MNKKYQKGYRNCFIVFDAASNTGYAVWEYRQDTRPSYLRPKNLLYHNLLIASGCIYTSNAKGNKLTYLETEVKKLLKEHQPQKAVMERLYTFPIRRRGILLSSRNQMYATYWHIVSKAISEWGIVCEEIDTRRLAKKKMARSLAKQYIPKKRYSDHEAECVVWGLYLIERGI